MFVKQLKYATFVKEFQIPNKKVQLPTDLLQLLKVE